MSVLSRKLRTVCNDLAQDAADRIEQQDIASAKSNDEICQTLGKVLGFPWYKDDLDVFPDATEADGVCVGDHVSETLAANAADRIQFLEGRLAAVTSKLEEHNQPTLNQETNL
jgi:hypothetical protein